MNRTVMLGIGLGALAIVIIVAVVTRVQFLDETQLLRQNNNENLNIFVDECIVKLPEGRHECDLTMRSTVKMVCAKDSSYDVCRDDRVDRYLEARSVVINKPDLSEEQYADVMDLNIEINNEVDSCMESLPEGLTSCDDDLRDLQRDFCQSGDMLDICRDGKVDEYYQARDLA